MKEDELSGRKDNEHSFLLGEEKLSAAFSLSPAPLIISDPETGRIVEVNESFESASGYTREDLIGHSALEFGFWKSGEERDRFIRKMTREKSVEFYEMRVRAKSGEIRDILHSSRLVEIAGRPYILAHIHDITLQKQADEEKKRYHDSLESAIEECATDLRMEVQKRRHLEEEMQMLAMVVHNTSEGVNVADLQGQMVFVNNAGTRMVGISQEEIGEYSVYDVIPEAYVDIVATEVMPAILAQGSWEGDLQYRNILTGKLTDVHAVAFLIRDPLGGEPLFLANLSVDITERKRAERELSRYRDHLEDLVKERTEELEERTFLFQQELFERRKAEKALRESEEKYRLVVENANEAIIVVQDGEIRFVNARGLSGYTEEELISQPITKLVHPDDRNMIMEKHRRRIAGECIPGVYEFRIVDKAGNTRLLETSSVLISWNGRPATLSFLTDITDRVKAEREKKELQNQLIQVQKMDALGRFAGGIAHDLNNLLHPVILDIEMLLEDAQADTGLYDILKQVLDAACRQRDLVKQILSFSRKNVQHFIPVHLLPLIRETISFLRASLPSTIEIYQHTDCRSDTIMGDPTQIQQVIMNLCRNAADALELQTGRIEVSLDCACLGPDPAHRDAPEGEYLRLMVRDTGCGMTKEVMDMVFEPFFTTKGGEKGIGMGLSIVHGILKSHGGAVTIESDPGRGSLFTVFLPKHDGEPLKQALPSRGIQCRARKSKILLVDDEESLLRASQRALQRSGFDVVAEKDARKVLDLFRGAPDEFDLVMTDMAMPGMTGVQLAAELMEIRPGIPVILSTGFSDIVDEQEAQAMGIREMLMKPAGMRELTEAVCRVLDR